MRLHDELNPAQREAVLHEGGPLLVLAGAGSGKTRVITHRMAELIHRGADPSRVLAVTFTNKAAGEMRERTGKLLGDVYRGAWIGTFHATCARILRMYAERAGLSKNFLIFDDGDQMSLCKKILKDQGLSEYDATPRSVLSAIDQAKNRGETPETFSPSDAFGRLVKGLYGIYQRRLGELQAVDFGDLLLMPLLLCKKDQEIADRLSRRFEHVLVDEFQDVNQVQYQLLVRLAGTHRQLTVVGDDDQAIYGWRGADARNLLEFEKNWPDAKAVKLEQNYRSPQLVLDAANAIIEKNQRRRGKRLFTERQGGCPLVLHLAQTERREAHFVVASIEHLMKTEGREARDFGVLYRTNAQSRVIEEALREVKLPYTVVGGMRFYDRAEVKDVLSYLRLCNNPAEEMSFSRVINVPPRGIGDGTMAKLEARSKLAGISLFQSLMIVVQSDGEVGAGPKKRLAAFLLLLQDLRRLALELPLPLLAEAVVHKTGYLERLRAEATPEAESREQNVLELLGSIREQAARGEALGEPLTLQSYLEMVSLESTTDVNPRGVALMTIHAAKGLEFPVVFVTGMEDGLFPSLRWPSRGGETQADRLDEERRLAYVAITRTRERLILTRAEMRMLYGQMQMNPASRFLLEIPRACMVAGTGPRSHPKLSGDQPAKKPEPRAPEHGRPGGPGGRRGRAAARHS